MNHIWNLIKKELRELITPASIVSIVVVAVIFASLGTFMGGEISNASEPPVIGLLNADGEESDYVKTYIEDYYKTNYKISNPKDYIIDFNIQKNPDDIINKMKETGVGSVIIIEKGYSAAIDAIKRGEHTQAEVSIFWNQSDTGMMKAAGGAATSGIVAYISAKTATDIIGGDNPGYKYSPIKLLNNHTYFNGKLYDGVTPVQILSAIQSQSMMMPILIMIIVMLIGGMIISSIANEKENKTLETLLTLPVKRTTIVAGKLIGSAIAGLIFGLVYMTGMYVYMNSLTSKSGLSLESLGLTLSIIDWGTVGIMMFLTILSALGMCMVLGAFVKNAKAAQTLTLPISVLAMIPMFVTMFADFSSLPVFAQALLFIDPFTHSMMAMNNMMFGNYVLAYGGLIYLIIFSLVMIYITVRIYNSDILLTGIAKRKGKGIFGFLTKNNKTENHEK